MTKNDETAKKIVADLLEEVGPAIASGDFERIAACYELPQRMDTFAGTFLVETPEEMRRVFARVMEHFCRAGVTEVIRECQRASFMSEDKIQCTHLTWLMSGSTLLERPYPVLSLLRRENGRWRIAQAQYAIADMPEMEEALTGSLKRLDRSGDVGDAAVFAGADPDV